MTDVPPGTALLESLAAIDAHFQILLVLAGALLISRLGPGRRNGLAGSMVLYVLGLAGFALASLLLAAGVPYAGAGRELAVFAMGLAAVRLGGLVLFRALLPRLGLRAPRMVEDLATFAGYALWLLMRLSHAGVDPGSLVTSSALVTAILAFALQEHLGNILGGATLQLEDSIHIGDWIKVDDVTGCVVDVGWRSTTIETRNWETIVIPNSALMKSKFAILGRRQGQPLQWRRWIWFTAGFDVPPTRVIATVEDALHRARIPGVAERPEPSCVLMDLKGANCQYALRYWLTDLARDDPTDSAVRERLHAAFRRAGIEFAFDEHVVHLVQSGEAEDERRRRKDLHQRTSILRQIDLFAGLSDSERAAIAEHLVYAPFLPGETLTRQGDVAHWLYLVVSGDVEVVLDVDGEQRRLQTIRGGAPDPFFGEMGMLTGAARSASVVATTEVECYRLDKQGFEQTLRARPAIAGEISEIMAKRQADLFAVREAADEEARRRMMEEKRGELLGRIRRFFSLEGS